MKVTCYGGLFDGRLVETRDDWPSQRIEFMVPPEPVPVLLAVGDTPTAVPYVVATYDLARTFDNRWVYVARNFFARQEPHEQPL